MTIYSELSEAIENGEVGWVTGWAQRALGEIVDGHRLVNAVCHPLGFLCVPLHRLGDEGVCVHLWEQRWERATPTTSPVHCHSWELLSCVLSGELRNETLRPVDDTESPTHRVFEVHSSAAGDEIRATDRLVRAETTSSITHGAGAIYSLPAGVFHQTLVPDSRKLVVTVALGMIKPGVFDLSLGGLRTASHRVRREVCDRTDTVEAARLAIAGQGVVHPLGG